MFILIVLAAVLYALGISMSILLACALKKANPLDFATLFTLVLTLVALCVLATGCAPKQIERSETEKATDAIRARVSSRFTPTMDIEPPAKDWKKHLPNHVKKEPAKTTVTIIARKPNLLGKQISSYIDGDYMTKTFKRGTRYTTIRYKNGKETGRSVYMVNQ